MQLIGGAHVSPRKQKLALRLAKTACLNARALLHDGHPEEASQVDTSGLIEQLTAAIDATTRTLVGSRELRHRAIRCRLFTYRAMAFSWADTLDKALADLKEALRLHGQDALALKCQARLREAFALRFKVPNPARFVPTCKSHADYLRQTGHESETNAAFGDSVDRVRRDRPYPEWFERRGVFAAPVQRAEPEPEPSRWDFVIHRLQDLNFDEKDRSDTRSLLLSHVDSLMEIFHYYCRLGSTQSGNLKRFVQIKAHQINKDMLTLRARRLYNAMFVQDPLTAPEPTLMNLRQFWQLARDCAFVDDHCDLADIDRVVVLAGRETAEDNRVIIEELKRVMAFKRQKDETGEEKVAALLAEKPDGPELGPHGEILTDDLSVCDDLNPHHPNNQLHAYEFVEAIIRCAVKYRAKKLQKARGASIKTGSEAGVLVGDCFRQLLSQNLLAHACSHEAMSADFWMFAAPAVQALVADYRVPMEKIFRYFSVPDPNTIVSVPGSGVQQYWKVRSKQLLDDTMDFNEIYRLLEKFELYDANFTPRDACKLFTRVTGAYILRKNARKRERERRQSPGVACPSLTYTICPFAWATFRCCVVAAGCDEIVAQIHKNNNDSEMILDEFMWFFFLVCMAKKKRRSAGQTVEGVVKIVRLFLDEEILAKTSIAGMPVATKALKADVGRKPRVGDYDGIAREYEEVDPSARLPPGAAER